MSQPLDCLKPSGQFMLGETDEYVFLEAYHGVFARLYGPDRKYLAEILRAALSLRSEPHET